MSQLQETR